MGAVYRADEKGIAQMLNSEWMEFAMRSKAGLVRAEAEATAPVDSHSDDPGEYKRSFKVTSGKHGGAKHNRAYGRCYNTASYAYYVEFGTRRVEAHHTLRRALYRALGASDVR